MPNQVVPNVSPPAKIITYYGDLLFPIVLEKHLQKRIGSLNTSFKYYGLRESDLSELGAKVTKPIYNLNNINDEVIILAGGETLGIGNSKSP
ncbi:hypothetical protein ACW7EJ_04910 [Acinetobacter soli]